jgi:hypothetical protein
MKKGCLAIFCCLVLSVPAIAEITGIELNLIYEPGLTSSYSASAGTQTLIGHNGAYVYTSDGTRYQFTKGCTSGQGVFANAIDSSSGGVASASFAGGSWFIKLYDPSNTSHLVLDVEGAVDWYSEFESAPNKVDGKGVVSLTSWYVDTTFWGDASWGSFNGDSGLKTSISNATQNGGALQDYQSDWSSNNVVLFIYADSNAIPEPATMSLLAAGAMVLRRMCRRK